MDKIKRQAFCAGVVFVFLCAATASSIASLSWVKALQLSPLIVGIILGMIYANTLRAALPTEWNGGISYCAKQVLRIGIVLFGFRISLNDVISVGTSALIIDALVVLLTLALGVGLGRLLRMDAQTALLCSVGSSICGAAAVLAAEPIVKGAPYKTTVAVSTVVIFGTLGMFLYPFFYRAGLLDMSAQELGLYTGGTLHEVAHVVGAGEMMNTSGEWRELVASGAANIQREAVIVKMIRVMMLAPVLLVLGMILSRLQAKDETGARPRASVPFFAIMFMVVIAFNSLQLLPESVVQFLNATSTFLLTMAMTALGLNTTFAQFKQAGWRPFVLALGLFIWLIFGGYLLVKLFA